MPDQQPRPAEDEASSSDASTPEHEHDPGTLDDVGNATVEDAAVDQTAAMASRAGCTDRGAGVGSATSATDVCECDSRPRRPTPRPAEPPADESPTVRTPNDQRTSTALPSRRAPAAIPARPAASVPPSDSWFTPVDAEVTQVLPRGPKPAPSPNPNPAQGPNLAQPNAATTQLPRPGGPGPDLDDPGGAGGPDERRPRRSRRALIVTVVVLGALGLLYAGDLALTSGSVPRGVVVAGVAVGDLPIAEAEQRLRGEIEPRTTRRVRVSVGEATSEIDPLVSGLSVDWPGTFAQVGEQPLNPITRITSFFTERSVGVVTSADRTALNAAMEELAPVVDQEPVEGSVRFDGTDPQPVDPEPGQQLDVAAAVDVLQRDWTNDGTVALPLIVRPPTTTPEDVVTAIATMARPAVAAPVTLLGENGVRGTITPEAIASALVFRAENAALVPELNQQVIQDAVAPQMARSERPGRDATLDFSGGSPVIVPSQDGRGIDYAATLADLLTVLTGEGPREITAVYADQPAEVTTEDLEALGNPEIIGEFTTGGFARDSGVNIRRAAEQINGTVVQPGETFSLNGATSPRDAANGYVEAGIISEGRASRGIGGGVSQVATTLYNAAYFAGMVDVEHREHSYYVSRYPPGREATVYEDAIDLEFRNDNPTAVLIETVWAPSSLTVRLYGTKRHEVTSTPGPRINPTSPHTITVPPGERCAPSQGAPGFTITDTRTLREISTGEVRAEQRTVRYNPVPVVICSG